MVPISETHIEVLNYTRCCLNITLGSGFMQLVPAVGRIVGLIRCTDPSPDQIPCKLQENN